jgi:hypothetical protein
MTKIVKLKIKDIENIVKKTINESEFNDTNDNIQPEDLKNRSSKKTMVIGKGEDGKIYAIDSETGDILGMK